MNSATVPIPVEDVQGDGRWMSQHNRFITEGREREPEVLFVGDSLIQRLAQTNVWESMFEPLHCLNFGIGGDQTQNILWRLMNGELDTLEAKVVVVLAGTNNYSNTAEEVTDGIMEIVNVIQNKQNSTQIIVMGLPPRGEKPNKLREKNAEINFNLSQKIENMPNVSFLNVEASMFVRENGLISHTDMYDYLHLTNAGYQKLCEPLLEEIQNLLQVFMKVENTSMTISTTASDVDEEDS
ncbi:platelet-activating factor acetylhydrolase IB subunit alpha2-like [Saccostrea cucullata]|uniref:platelet-activating factor acetylhydrolase IB subunit alpha2-like n=1 Tax=Saccostrea cuccullata TaxID=36930 RepID=UPI002ED12351